MDNTRLALDVNRCKVQRPVIQIDLSSGGENDPIFTDAFIVLPENKFPGINAGITQRQPAVIHSSIGRNF